MMKFSAAHHSQRAEELRQLMVKEGDPQKKERLRGAWRNRKTLARAALRLEEMRRSHQSGPA
jgi:hypothetical protein